MRVKLLSQAFEIRQNEVAVELPQPSGAELFFIGRIHTPWTELKHCPRQGDAEGPVCSIEIFEPWYEALQGLKSGDRLDAVYWLHLSRRDLVRQSPGHAEQTRGTFAIRSPIRPNPIGISTVTLVSLTGPVLEVRGLDCLDNTPLLDIKPHRCPFA